MLDTDRAEYIHLFGTELNLEDLLPVSLGFGDLDAFLALLVQLLQIKYMDLMIVTHISTGEVLAIVAECQGRDRTTSLGQSHHELALGRFSIPHEDHGREANLASCNESSVMVDSERDDIVAMAELTLLGALLPLLDFFLATAEDFLFTCLTVHNDAEGSCHVYTLSVAVVVEILARKIRLVTVNEVNLELLVRGIDVHIWRIVRFFDRS